MKSSRIAFLIVVTCTASCHGGSARNAGDVDVRDTFARVEDDPARATPTRDELLREAMAGVVEGNESDFTSRMQLRNVRVPHPARGANAQFNFDGTRRGWITAMPNAELLTSAAFAQGKIFIGGGFSSNQFYALDAYTGALHWALTASDGGPSAAIIKRGRVLFNTESCTLFVANAETGEFMWKRWLGDPLMSQPTADDEHVYSAYPSPNGYQFGAFRLDDGEPVWTLAIAADVIQAPQIRGDSIYFATMEGSAFRVRTHDGHAVWQRDVSAASAVWVDRDDVLLARRVDSAEGPKEQAIVLDARDGSVKSEGELESAPYFSGQSRDRVMASTQAGAWGNVVHGAHLGLRNVASGWAYQGSTPTVADGRAYYAVAGTLVARDTSTGHTVWRRRYAAAENAQAISPPAVVGGMLLFGTIDGHLYATDIDTGMTLFAYDLGEPISFQPVVAQGWVYVTTARGSVIGMELADAELDGWHMWGGNAEHGGLVETAGTVDPALLASLARPSRGVMQAVRENENSVNERPELPLARTVVRGRVSGDVARVTVTQTFRNPFDTPIEAVYLFPLPAGAAVDAMQMHIGDRVVRARIQERTQAQRTYNEARAEGRRAALLEQQRETLFAQRVANIAPHESIDVQIEYAEQLDFEEGEYELSFPMASSRRYDPATHSAAQAAMVDADGGVVGTSATVSANYAEANAQAPVELHFEVVAGMPIERIASPTHTVNFERPSSSRAIASLTETEPGVHGDFVMRWATSGATPRAAVLTTRDETSGYLSLVLQPPEAPNDNHIAARDLVFLVDTSSSMRGSLAQSQAVLHRVLDGLRPDDTLQIHAFSDAVTRLADAPLVANAANVTRAHAFVHSLRAAGATEMVPAIANVLAAPHEPALSRLRMVVLLSDGFIANEAEVLRTIATNLDDTRFYALGVGASPNRFVLERAAEVGRGRALFASLSEEPDEVATRFFRYVDRPVFTDITVDWGGLAVSDVYPRHVPDLFAQKPVVLHGRFSGAGEGVVRVRGTMGGRRYERTIHVALPETSVRADANAVQSTLWARAAIDDRMQRMALREDPVLVREVTELGLHHHLVTRWTSFVAVDMTPTAHEEASEGSTATLSPARALPGDPEIRVHAPADALAVTFILPFGETVSASYEHDLDAWSGRFLIPRDTADGSYPITVVITRANEVERTEVMHLWYTVDSAAPVVTFEVVGEVRAGTDVLIRAHQVVTHADLTQAGFRSNALTQARAEILSDANRVQMRTPSGVIDMQIVGPGTWEATVHIPDDAHDVLEWPVFAIDMAANVRESRLSLRVAP